VCVCRKVEGYRKTLLVYSMVSYTVDIHCNALTIFVALNLDNGLVVLLSCLCRSLYTVIMGLSCTDSIAHDLACSTQLLA